MRIARQISATIIKFVALVVTLYAVSLLGLRLAGFEFAVVASNSMSPTITAGDLVLLHSVDYTELQVGSIIQYEKRSQFILHRIYSIEKYGLRTKGDSNLGTDPAIVRPKQVVAIASGALKGFGLPILLFKNVLNSIALNANFTSHQVAPSKSTGGIWINPVANWKPISSLSGFTFVGTSGVSTTSRSTKTILINKNTPTDKHFYSEFRLTARDTIIPHMTFYADACTSGTTIICGWLISLSEIEQRIYLQTISPAGVKQIPIWWKSIPLAISNQTKVLIYSSSSLLQILIDGEIVLNLPNPLEYASLHGANPPSGNYFGLSLNNSNQFTSSKTMTW